MGLALRVAVLASEPKVHTAEIARHEGALGFASIFPIVTVMLYALFAERFTRSKGETS